jgi:hypothetical protein
MDFGDVITFDTIHKTNSKKMPLAMFVGCSNNLKNVLFGQALLRDDTTDTFRWLFESFKSCMGGRQPFVILTGAYFEGEGMGLYSDFFYNHVAKNDCYQKKQL